VPVWSHLRGGITWSWWDALRCGTCTLPAALVALSGDPTKGLAWAMGILPAAIVGMAPRRRDRRRLILVGALFAVSIIVGSLLAQTTATTIIGIFLVAYGTALLASRKAFGLTAMTLCAPVAAIGLSYGDMGKAAGLGLLIFGGSAFSYVVFMLWPDAPAGGRAAPAPPLLAVAYARRYGVLLGLAAASAAAIGVAIHTDHVGWAAAAALFVMRPSWEMQELRSVGRVVSVFLGALVAVAYVRSDPSAAAVAGLAIVAIAGAGATHESRWYVTPFFGTWVVITMLLYSNPTVAEEQWRFNERVGETVLGVGLAYVFGLLLPVVLARLHRPPGARDG